MKEYAPHLYANDNYAPVIPIVHLGSFPGPSTPPNQHPAPTQPIISAAYPPQIPADVLAMTNIEADDQVQARMQGSNRKKNKLIPAQSRRKAQNRIAQRAFRERKERHVKDLESRLKELEQTQQQTASENERLKRDLQRMSTENEILRATSMVNGAGLPGSNGSPMVTGPMSYNPTAFYADVLQNHTKKTLSHSIVTSNNGGRLLAAGATWNIITSNDFLKRSLGPVFEERAILEAIEQSAASETDELL
ncbi:putative bzip transcription factor protein [Rhypophila decipiens]|uniref:Bzip transcription factor protein n=1 Tax=Rhypophila decipiens TaxID=261697 RepID=A0AAN7AYU4_9PEZI|nr:putative bzip transcription factor protein [Rhypophila decipiens]